MAGLYTITTRSPGTTLTAAIYNADHQNHVDNEIPTMMDDYSLSSGQMQTNTDPGEVGTESLATSLAGELERMRFAIKEIKGTAQWYETAGASLSPAIVAIAVNTTLTSAAKGKLHNITAAATIDLPAASTMNVSDAIRFKSSTEQSTLIQRQSTDTIDGDTSYRIPAYATIEVMKSAAGTYILTQKPDVDVGKIVPFGGATAPRGWSLSDNVLLNRVNQGNLFAVYGTTHGAGDGSTTFGKVDMRGRAPFGKDDMGGSAANRLTSGTSGVNGAALGAVGGDERSQQHAHGTGGEGHGHPSSTISPATTAGAASGGDLTVIRTDAGGSIALSIAGAATGLTISNSGAGTSQNVPPAAVVNYIVKL